MLVLLVNVKPVESQLPVTVNVPVPVSVPVSIVLVASMFEPVVEMVPLIVRLLKLLLEFRKFRVLVVPVIVMVLVPFVNVPAAEESQLPEQVQDPEVKESVVPAPTVTSRKVTVAVVTVRPPVPTRESEEPPVMLLAFVVRMPLPEVASVLDTSMAPLVLTVPETV